MEAVRKKRRLRLSKKEKIRIAVTGLLVAVGIFFLMGYMQFSRLMIG